MTVQNISSGVSLGAASPTGRFFLPGATAFADSLNVGQIIQGRVLRGFEENRYLVAFAGDERVVDSAVPLTAGEILYGRVVGLGDRVELQRIYPSSQEINTRPAPAADARSSAAFTGTGTAIDNILQRYRVDLTESDRATLLRAARAAEDPEAMGLAAAMLSKLGLPQAGVLLDVMYRAQFAAGLPSPASNPDLESVPQVTASWQQAAEVQATSVRQLADLVGRIAQDKHASPAARTETADTRQTSSAAIAAIPDPPGRRQPDLFPDEESRRNAQSALAERILNAQTGGVVAHRCGLLPLLVGGRLVEVSFALFEQHRSATQPQGMQHRQVQFSLQTQQLGQVNILARITGAHVRLQISTGSEEGTSEAALHADSLENALLESGWSVDEVAYGTHLAGSHSAVVRSVIEHVVSLDSLNRLV